ncbi:MAG: hypothetical protein K8S15_09090 [Candidatus Aegiribacteria sp.]|nr:hypothetical protein [Candidatus Aegiribacteria sp.]
MRNMLFLVLLCGSCALAQPSVGVHTGILIPTGEFAQTYSLSPAVGVDILVPFLFGHLESSLEYVFLTTESENRSAYMIPVLFGGRMCFGSLYFGGGVALHTLKWEEAGQEEKTSEFGGYWNIGTDVLIFNRDIEIAWKIHLLDFDDTVLSLSAGTYF